MNSKKLIASILLCSAVSLSASYADDGRISIPYEVYSITDAAASPYWSDVIPKLPQGTVSPPQIFLSVMSTSSGGTMAVSMMSAPFYCGLSECPVRLYEDGNFLAEFSACAESETHAFSADGRFFLSCDLSHEIKK